MKTTLLFLIVGVVCFTTYGQHEFATATSRATIETPISNIDRYGYDYYLTAYSFNGDSSILEALDLDRLESFRQSNSAVVVEDKVTGLMVTLIARNRIGHKDGDELNPDEE